MARFLCVCFLQNLTMSTEEQQPPKRIHPDLLKLNNYRRSLKLEDLNGCAFLHVHKFLMGEGLETGQDRADFMKALYFYQLADWNGWTGWHPEIVADYVWTINLQRAWGTERQKQRGTTTTATTKPKRRMVMITPQDTNSHYYMQDEIDHKLLHQHQPQETEL